MSRLGMLLAAVVILHANNLFAASGFLTNFTAGQSTGIWLDATAEYFQREPQFSFDYSNQDLKVTYDKEGWYFFALMLMNYDISRAPRIMFQLRVDAQHIVDGITGDTLQTLDTFDIDVQIEDVHDVCVKQTIRVVAGAPFQQYRLDYTGYAADFSNIQGVAFFTDRNRMANSGPANHRYQGHVWIDSVRVGLAVPAVAVRHASSAAAPTPGSRSPASLCNLRGQVVSPSIARTAPSASLSSRQHQTQAVLVGSGSVSPRVWIATW